MVNDLLDDPFLFTQAERFAQANTQRPAPAGRTVAVYYVQHLGSRAIHLYADLALRENTISAARRPWLRK